MFLESITACGFLDVGPETKFELNLQRDSNVNITIINNLTFIKAYLLIFDTKYARKYGSEHDLKQFGNPQYRGDSFVESTFWQSDQNTLTDYKWLQKNRLTVRRYLKDSTRITINGKSMDIKAFHKAISSLGYISIDGFNMHHLLEREIFRLETFSGDHFWNLIAQVNECTDLAQIIEMKHRKRKIINVQMKSHVADMQDVLPVKLQLRKDIQSHFQLSRRFNTLMSIVDKKKLKILRKQQHSVTLEFDSIAERINEKAQEIQNLKETMKDEELKMKNDELKMSLVQCERNSLVFEMEKLAIATSFDEQSLVEMHQRFVSLQMSSVKSVSALEKSLDECLVHLKENIQQLQVDVKLSVWKMSLKQSQNSPLFERFWNQFQLETTLHQTAARNLEKMINDLNDKIQKSKTTMGKPILLNSAAIKTANKVHNNEKLLGIKAILALNQEMHNQRLELMEINRDIISVAMFGDLQLKSIETLKTIENFVGLHPNLSVDYLGPVFKFLDPVNDFDCKAWPQLLPIANIVLFTQGSTARKANRQLIESKCSIGSYVLLGVDELVVSSPPQLPTELEDKIKSATAMVRDDFEFKNVLKQLLQDMILISESEVDTEDLVGLQTFIIHNSCGSTTQAKEFLTYHSFIPNTFEARGLNPITVLLNVYENIQNYTKTFKSVEELKTLKLEMEEEMLQNERKYIRKIKELNGLSTISSVVEAIQQFVTLSEKRSKLQETHALNIVMVDALTAAVEEDINSWNVDELKLLKAEKEAELDEAKLEASEMEMESKARRSKLECFISKLSTQHVELVNCLVTVIDREFALKVSDEYQNHIDLLNGKLVKIQNKLRGPSPHTISNKTLCEIELLDIRCRLYEINSEKNRVDDAIRQSQLVIELCGSGNANFDSTIYGEFRKAPLETISAEITQCRQQLKLHKRSNVKMMSKEEYGHLIESIKKVERYSESPVAAVKRNKIASRAFPIINKVLVKVLKDAVHNYKLAFGTVMSDYIRKSILYFYTRGMFDEIKEDDFSWSCFDIGRLKAMDFVVEWKKNRKDHIPSAVLRKIKGLLLIMHIISYLSVFKVIIIHESFYDNMDEHLTGNIKMFLEAVAPFVQIVLVNEDVQEDVQESMQQEFDEVEPMDTM